MLPDELTGLSFKSGFIVLLSTRGKEQRKKRVVDTFKLNKLDERNDD